MNHINTMKLALEALELAQDNLRDHGDNCFLHDEGEYNQCFCGKDSLSNHLQSVVEKLDKALAEQPAQDQRPFCYHDGRNIVGKEFAHHSDVFPLYTAPQPAQTDWEAVAADQAMTIALLKADQPAQGCDHCNHALYAGTKCKNCGRVTEQAAIKRDLTPEQLAQQEPVAWMYDQAKYRENDLRGRQWAFNCFSQNKPWVDDMVRNLTPLYTSPPAQRKPLGFAGVTVWVGDAVATQIVTEVAIQCERIPSQSITMAAQRCVDMLAAHGIKEK